MLSTGREQGLATRPSTLNAAARGGFAIWGRLPLACGCLQPGRAGDSRVMGTQPRAQVSRAGQRQQGTPLLITGGSNPSFVVAEP